MRGFKVWLFSGLLVAMLAGAAMLTGTSSGWAQPGGPVQGGYWRHHDGRWNYWHEGDRRWYHTDGSHWYYHNGNAWQPYRFDRQFGREGFERGEYRPPGEGAAIVVPRHEVYRPR
jgi:hypothetical protein